MLQVYIVAFYFTGYYAQHANSLNEISTLLFGSVCKSLQGAKTKLVVLFPIFSGLGILAIFT